MGNSCSGSPAAVQAEKKSEVYKPESEAFTVDSLGRYIATSRFRLAAASEQYKKELFVEPGSIIPFNETPAGKDKDHWFELPLKDLACSKRLAEDNMQLGRLFTTRLPRGITQSKGFPEEGSGVSDPVLFKKKVQEYGVKHVFVLVEEEELPTYGSSGLWAFYKSCGLQIWHRPIHDFSLPSLAAEEHNINDVSLKLAGGEGVLVHCAGGSGRTGTVVVAVLKQLGCKTPIHTARKEKSVYLETIDQEHLIEGSTFDISRDFLINYPLLAAVLVNEWLHHLCENVHRVIQSDHPVSQTKELALEKIFHLFDKDKSGQLSIEEMVDALKMVYLDKSQCKVTINDLEKLFDKLQIKERNISLPVFVRLMNTLPWLPGA